MTTDKLDAHYFQQLSALMDGDLPPEQARFLLRRLQHDSGLTGCWERWQLCGDVLRGQAQAPAPAGFAERIAVAIAAEPKQAAASATTGRAFGSLGKWGGGALAASVALVAFFMVRQQTPEQAPAPAAPTIASQLPENGTPSTTPDAAAQTAASAVAASVAVASAPRRQNETPRRSATRTQQAARRAAAVRAPERAVATAAAPPINPIAVAPAASNERDPFSGVQIDAPVARPWPRAVLPQYSSGSGGLNADYTSDRAAQTFYPFEPRLPQSPPVALPEESAPLDR